MTHDLETPTSPIEPVQPLMTTNELAAGIKCSPVTVRVQRHKQKKGLPHWLTLVPVYIGDSPRYIPEEYKSFIASLKHKRERNSSNGAL